MCSRYITAIEIYVEGFEYWNLHSKAAKLESISSGHHTNVFLRVGKNDYNFAKDLCHLGIYDAVLLRPGFWKIGKWYFCPKTCKYSDRSGWDYSKLESFMCFVKDILCLPADKK